MRRKLDVLTGQKGVYIDESTKKDLVVIMEENNSIVKEFPKQSFQRLFFLAATNGCCEEIQARMLLAPTVYQVLLILEA